MNEHQEKLMKLAREIAVVAAQGYAECLFKSMGIVAAIEEESDTKLAERCRVHADKMEEEGWYITANVLWEAAKALEKRGE